MTWLQHYRTQYASNLNLVRWEFCSSLTMSLTDGSVSITQQPLESGNLLSNMPPVRYQPTLGCRDAVRHETIHLLLGNLGKAIIPAG